MDDHKIVDVSVDGLEHRVYLTRTGGSDWYVEGIDPEPDGDNWIERYDALFKEALSHLPMRVLVACEESQAVTKEFRKLGHEAFSCDFHDCSGGHPEWHIKGDCMEAIRGRGWDMIIMHPPCTHLTVAGNRHYARGKHGYHLREKAALFVQELWDLATSVCHRVVMENPVGCLSTMCDLPKPQYIQPYEYGHKARKKTGLWLHGVEPLRPTELVDPEIIEYTRADGSKTTFSADYMRGVDRSGKMKASGKRSKTYDGIARAMAEQWGGYICQSETAKGVDTHRT